MTVRSHASPVPSWSVSVCERLATDGQLSHASPTVSPSASAWFAFDTPGQLSEAFSTPSQSPSLVQHPAIDVYTHPVAGLQPSVVHSSESSHETAEPPAQFPAPSQASPDVQASPSLQTEPAGFGGCEHTPVAGL